MFVRSKYGRSIRAIRDNEIAAAASGINVSYYKMLTFTISAFFAGITGALYACCNAALSTTSFAFTNGSILNSVFIVVMVVVGGMGSLTGSVVAAVVLFLLNYTIKNGAWVAALPALLQNVFTYPMLVYSIALVIVIKHTKMGMAMRAVAKDFDTAQLMGIRIDRVISITFVIGSFLAAVGSILYFSYIGQVSPTIGAMPGLKSFVAAVFGGIGSVPGAVIGSYIIGICETFIKSNQDISIFSNAFTFALLIIILLIKPNGLFGEKLKEKV